MLKLFLVAQLNMQKMTNSIIPPYVEKFVTATIMHVKYKQCLVIQICVWVMQNEECNTIGKVVMAKSMNLTSALKNSSHKLILCHVVLNLYDCFFTTNTKYILKNVESKLGQTLDILDIFQNTTFGVLQ